MMRTTGKSNAGFVRSIAMTRRTSVRLRHRSSHSTSSSNVSTSKLGTSENRRTAFEDCDAIADRLHQLQSCNCAYVLSPKSSRKPDITVSRVCAASVKARNNAIWRARMASITCSCRTMPHVLALWHYQTRKSSNSDVSCDVPDTLRATRPIQISQSSAAQLDRPWLLNQGGLPRVLRPNFHWAVACRSMTSQIPWLIASTKVFPEANPFELAAKQPWPSGNGIVQSM